MDFFFSRLLCNVQEVSINYVRGFRRGQIIFSLDDELEKCAGTVLVGLDGAGEPVAGCRSLILTPFLQDFNCQNKNTSQIIHSS